MFSAAAVFDQPLSFDTSSVKNMRYMFSVGAAAFNQPLSFDTSSVTDMTQMFHAAAFNQPLSFDTSNVTTMHAMFYVAAAFNQPLSFDTSSVFDMYYMFGVCSARALGPSLQLGLPSGCVPRVAAAHTLSRLSAQDSHRMHSFRLGSGRRRLTSR